MESIMSFFGAETTMEAIYWLVASISTGVISLKVILNMIGSDFDYDFDLELAGEELSLSAFASFASIGGWAGVFAHHFTDMSNIGILWTSLSFGTFGFVLSIFLMKKLHGMESSGNILMENAVGKVAEVYLGIPAGKVGNGQVQVLVQGRLIVANALSDDAIETGSKVLVYGTENGLLLVAPYNESLIEE